MPQIQVAKPTLSFDETNENRVAVNSKAFGYKKWSGDNTWSNSDKYEIELKNVNDFAVRGAYDGQCVINDKVAQGRFMRLYGWRRAS